MSKLFAVRVVLADSGSRELYECEVVCCHALLQLHTAATSRLPTWDAHCMSNVATSSGTSYTHTGARLIGD